MSDGPGDLDDHDYRSLAEFRFEIRRFLNFSADLARQAGLAPVQHQALLAIRGADAARLSIGDLARELFIQPHTASELAARLEKAGLVEREAGADSRVRVLRLTSAGSACLASLSRAHREEVHRMDPLLRKLLARFEN